MKPYDVLSTGNRRDGGINIVAELAGAEVCTLAGIPAPQTGLIYFPSKPTPDLYNGIDAKDLDEVRTLFAMNRGKIAFCCAYLSEAPDIDPDELSGVYGRGLTETWGSTLVAVDAYLRHDDRRTANPNAIKFHGAVVAVDHGSAFAGISRPGMTGHALAQQVVLNAPASFREHVFFAAVRKWYAGIDWDVICARLTAISPAQVDVAALWWPKDLEPHRSQVVEFLRERGKHVSTIVDSVAQLTRPPAKAA